MVSWTAPARLVSDQLINIYFQEWAPLFPILHKPTFLKLYEDYVACPEAMEDKPSLAQLNLVFSIAAHSSNVRGTAPRNFASLTSQSPNMHKRLNRLTRNGMPPWSNFSRRALQRRFRPYYLRKSAAYRKQTMRA
jgi:hypothetical protein